MQAHCFCHRTNPIPFLIQSVTRSPSDLKAEKLNYEAIQEELSGHSVRAKVLLMQALRWVRRSSYLASIIWRCISVSDQV